MKTITIFGVKFTYAEFTKIILMIIIAVYCVFWLITFWGVIVVALYGKNPGDIAKFWIKINSLSPVASIAMFIAVTFTAYKICKKEESVN